VRFLSEREGEKKIGGVWTAKVEGTRGNNEGGEVLS